MQQAINDGIQRIINYDNSPSGTSGKRFKFLLDRIKCDMNQRFRPFPYLYSRHCSELDIEIEEEVDKKLCEMGIIVDPYCDLDSDAGFEFSEGPESDHHRDYK